MMAEISTFWDGIVTGDHGPYNDDQFSDLVSSIFTAHRATQSAIKDCLNELAVTNPVGLTIRMATGKAIIDGKPYTNTSNKDFVLSKPPAGKQYYTLVLKKDFSAQTVRAIMLGPDIFAPPVVTQVDGCNWEVSIATISVSSIGVVVITDTREFCSIPMQLTTDRIENLAIGHVHLKDYDIDYTRLDIDIFPYVNVGEIACYTGGVGVLQTIPQGTAGGNLTSMGAGEIPVFIPKFNGAVISTVTPQVIPNDGFAHDLVLDVVTKDAGYWGAYATVADSIVVPVGAGGVYMITGSCKWSAVAGNTRGLYIKVAGAGMFGDYEALDNTPAEDMYQNSCGIALLADGDAIKLRVLHDAGVISVDEAYLAVVKLGM